MNRYDLVTTLGYIGVLLFGLTCIYGAFWWFNTFVSPFFGLTIVEIIQEPFLEIVFMVLSIWAIPGLALFGIAIIFGLVAAILD